MKDAGNCVVDNEGLVWVNEVVGCRIWRFDEDKGNLPPLPEVKLELLMKIYHLNERQASQVMNSEYADLFEKLARETNIPQHLLQLL
jgi:Glu-tRNA(Gln) amidotransferase subunit E-like FAD-binding protein